MSENPHSSVPGNHHVRTALASLLGAIALWLILASLIIVWLNRTLLNTPAFVNAVAPVVKQPAVQVYIARSSTDQLLQSAPLQILASELAPGVQSNEMTDDQLTSLLEPMVYANLLQLVQSPNFGSLWKDTVTSAQRQMISQLNENSSQLTLNLNPAVVGAVSQLRQTKLSPISSQITVSPSAAKFNLEGGAIDRVHEYYQILQEGTVGIVLLAIFITVLSVVISIDHAKTIRRILIGTGVSSFVLAASIASISIIKLPNGDQVQRAAALAIAGILFHNLQIAALVLGTFCLAAGIFSKAYFHNRVR